MMACVIYGYSSARTTPEVSLYWSLTLEGNAVAVNTQNRVVMTIWKGKLETKLHVLVDFSYLPKFFNILAVFQKYFSFYPPSLFNIYIASWGIKLAIFSW